MIGNKAVTLACNVIYNSWISDVMTCHKAMSLELFRSLDLRERGFGIEPEIAAKLLRRGVRIYEVLGQLRGEVAGGRQEADGAGRPARPPDAAQVPASARGLPLSRRAKTIGAASASIANAKK